MKRQIVIEIDEKKYNNLIQLSKSMWKESALNSLEWAIVNGTPLPKGHGRLIDKDHIISRLESASKYYGGECADAFDERFAHGLKEAAIKVAEEPTIIEADKEVE